MTPTTPEERDPLADRLRDAFPDEVAPATRHRDLAAIDQALTGPATRLRRGAVIAVAGLVVAAPAGALASESALPGEALYPVKRVTEVVRQVFDEDVVDRHRVEEAEVLADRAIDLDESTLPDANVHADDAGAVAVAVDAAFDAVVATEDRADADELRQRALAAADRVTDRANDLVVALPAADAQRIARLRAERLDRLQRELQRQQALRDREQRAPDSDHQASDRPASDRPASDRPDTRPTRTDEPTASPRPEPTRTSDEVSPQPQPSSSPTREPSPAPTREPSPAPTREPSPEPSSSPTTDTPDARKERHEVGRAGVVHLVVRAEGVRLSEVVVADAWTARADRSREPAGFTVEFRNRRDGRGLLFTARHRDDGTVVTSVRELPPPDDTSPSDDPSPAPSRR